MHSAKPTTAKVFLLFFVALGLHHTGYSQENSPYSRYGLGDLVPNQNIISRGMGGITAGLADDQSINFTNPASLGNMSKDNFRTYFNNVIFDMGGEVDFRTLKSNSLAEKSTSVNSLFSYLQLAFPIASKKMERKGINWGVSFGLKPVSRINYNIEKDERPAGLDSLQTIYTGSGGLSQAFLGTGFRIHNFSVGVNFGYMFGNKDYATKLSFINDSVAYAMSNTAITSTFGGVFFSAGFQYNIHFPSKALLRIGAYGNLQEKMTASQDNTHETYALDGNGSPVRVDSVAIQTGVKGTVQYPSSFGVGFTYKDNDLNPHWVGGVDFEVANWSNYRYYDQADQVQNSWTIRGGVQYIPGFKKGSSKRGYFNYVNYRGGFYYGPDYINVNESNSRPNYGVTFGTGMPLTLNRSVMLNTALEVGGRGNKASSVQESIVRFSVGLSMSARWFQKPKYD